jgi:ribosomal protein S18 acetylase RimI-like enzyme
MASSDLRIARPVRVAAWRALEGTEVIGEANAMLRPDQRWFISVDTWNAESFLPLVSAVACDLRHDLYTTVDEGDEPELRRWNAAGFTVLRREDQYLIPVDPDQRWLAGAALPAGMSLVAADAVDEDGLRLLDEALRADVPGTGGWINDPQEFRERTFDERRFDPATYLVAVDDLGQAFAGLARVWNHPRQPRLDLVGIMPGYRRRGLAKILLAAVLAPLRDRGISDVAAEADQTSLAANALLSGIGARRVGGSVELVRRRRPDPSYYET